MNLQLVCSINSTETFEPIKSNQTTTRSFTLETNSKNTQAPRFLHSKNPKAQLENKMNKFVAFTCLFAVVAVLAAQAAPVAEQADPLAKPNPYTFSYSADSLGGRSSHSEQGDGNGRVQGFYTILGADGRERRVEYVADELGYRATIQTNEVGTKGDSAANAEYIVSAPTDQQMAQANQFQRVAAAPVRRS